MLGEAEVVLRRKGCAKGEGATPGYVEATPKEKGAERERERQRERERRTREEGGSGQ